MKFLCDQRKINKQAKQRAEFEAAKKWHRVFCYFPQKIAPNDCRWLEWVETRISPEWISNGLSSRIRWNLPVLYHNGYAEFDYREIKKDES